MYTEQKIPKISDKDIIRIVRRDFPQLEFGEIESILCRYKAESKEGRNRVYASILKLSNGDIDMVKNYVNVAISDYRDVIALSEYPKYSEHAFADNLSEKMKMRLIMDDWLQYQEWFNKM